HLKGLVSIESAEAGMHLLARFSDYMLTKDSDRNIADRAQEKGVSVTPLSVFHYQQETYTKHNQGLLFGYAAVKEEDMEKFVLILKEVMTA
ncbi:MAG: hypothetical protein R3261_07745, partial [Alphaproteobacteria bacterium]|nr:hypothetical protein [Alphaproteobacteria bacterium]